MNWREMIDKADAFKATGKTDIYIDPENRANLANLPWEWVTTVEPWGSHRLDIDTGVRIEAEHPSGLTFRWSIDIEDRAASGKSYYNIQTARIKQVLALLPFAAKQQFQTYLTDCAEKMEQGSMEQWRYLQQQFRDAALLRKLGDAKPPEGEVSA